MWRGEPGSGSSLRRSSANACPRCAKDGGGIAEDPLHEIGARDHGAAPVVERQQRSNSLAKRDRPALHEHRPRAAVEPDGPKLSPRPRDSGPPAARCGARARRWRDQLQQAERFRDVVVGASLSPRTRSISSPRAVNRSTGSAKPSARRRFSTLESVQSRKHHVEDHQRVPAATRFLQGRRPVGGHVHLVAFDLEVVAKAVGRSVFLGDQDPDHESKSPSSGRVSSTRAPPFGASSMATRPPWRRTIAHDGGTQARAGARRARSRSDDGSAPTRARSAGGIPGPASSTRRRTPPVPPRRRHDGLTRRSVLHGVGRFRAPGATARVDRGRQIRRNVDAHVPPRVAAGARKDVAVSRSGAARVRRRRPR